MNFLNSLKNRWKNADSLVCVGLDPEIGKLPQHLKQEKNPTFSFNKAIIDATHDLVCAYKPQYAFYAAQGIEGIESLIKTIKYIHKEYPDIPVILDAKRGDVEHTVREYVKEAFDVFSADAVTVNPYLGMNSLEPFLERRDKGIIILCRTSNPGAAQLQDLKVGRIPFYEIVAKEIVLWHKKYGNCLMVVGATWPKQLAKIRKIAPEIALLLPGIGAQGGDVEKTVRAGVDKNRSGIIISSSRGIIYASGGKDFAEKSRQKTQELRDEINKYRRG